MKTLNKSLLPNMASIQVGNRDTLTSVAARFDTTPGELTSLNKLNSSFIYPGQSLLVPDKTATSGENISDFGNDVAIQNIPTEKTRKLSTEEVQQEEKERGNYQMSYYRNHNKVILRRICHQLIIIYTKNENLKQFWASPLIGVAVNWLKYFQVEAATQYLIKE